MGKKPDYDRARNALAFYAQKIGIKMHWTRNDSAFARDFSFLIALKLNGAPLWDGAYVMGAGHRQADGSPAVPEIADVLHSIFLDASCFEDAGDLLEFASEFGYATDTHDERNKVRSVFQTCARTARHLRDGLDDQQHATLTQLSSMV